jgi:hypothetical protein
MDVPTEATEQIHTDQRLQGTSLNSRLPSQQSIRSVRRDVGNDNQVIIFYSDKNFALFTVGQKGWSGIRPQAE